MLPPNVINYYSQSHSHRFLLCNSRAVTQNFSLSSPFFLFALVHRQSCARCHSAISAKTQQTDCVWLVVVWLCCTLYTSRIQTHTKDRTKTYYISFSHRYKFMTWLIFSKFAIIKNERREREKPPHDQTKTAKRHRHAGFRIKMNNLCLLNDICIFFAAGLISFHSSFQNCCRFSWNERLFRFFSSLSKTNLHDGKMRL